MPSQKEITNLLIQSHAGDPAAGEALLVKVYDELRALARRYLIRERQNHTLQPTALVHEAYLRLVDQSRASWENQAHFFRLAAQMMRRILVDHARSHLAEKRGGGAGQLSITRVADLGVKQDADLVAIDEALEALNRLDPQKSKIVELRFFAGLTVAKTAKVLGVSKSTVERDWVLARLWLFRKIGKGERDGHQEMAGD